SVPIYWNSFTYYENKVRVRVEKYFFDTLPTGQTVDVSTFIEGGGLLPILKKYKTNLLRPNTTTLIHRSNKPYLEITY
ncbi:hypothetical protein, partial [Heyndrickxia sporothermodurans]